MFIKISDCEQFKQMSLVVFKQIFLFHAILSTKTINMSKNIAYLATLTLSSLNKSDKNSKNLTTKSWNSFVCENKLEQLKAFFCQ